MMRIRHLRHRHSSHLILLLAAVLLSACATAPLPQESLALFQDARFKAPTESLDVRQVFAVSPAMRRYLREEIGEQLYVKGPQQGLIDALYSKNQLKVDYDAARTRNAAETFEERAGNCLSLVIMTAALAKELGLPVRYQSVFIDESWSRAGGILFAAGHVNLTVGRRYTDIKTKVDDNISITIDFNPPVENKQYHHWQIGEATVLAMYMNNRSAEALARGDLDNAYWLAREAILQDPTFISAYNTLGVVYRRHGDFAEAERVLQAALAREPGNMQAMSNLEVVLRDQGRHEEARAWSARVELRRPYAPFHFFNQGQAALDAGDVKQARDLFARELSRDPYNHEFHFWMAVAQYRLGDMDRTRKHLSLAMDYSPTRRQHDLYAAKLDRMRSFR